MYQKTPSSDLTSAGARAPGLGYRHGPSIRAHGAAYGNASARIDRQVRYRSPPGGKRFFCTLPRFYPVPAALFGPVQGGVVQ